MNPTQSRIRASLIASAVGDALGEPTEFLKRHEIDALVDARGVRTFLDPTDGQITDDLLAYLYDGQLEIDNNLMENAIRPIALGRKNWLFAGSHDAAENIAMFRSFFATCVLNNIDPHKWLLYVLDHINTTKPSQYHTLLPHLIDPELVR